MKLRKKQKNPLRADAFYWGLLAGVGQIIYIVLVTLFLSGMEALGPQPLGGFASSFVAFLMLFVLSAVITAILVFGRPMYLILSKQYAQAVATLMSTLLTMLGAFVVYFLFTVAF